MCRRYVLPDQPAAEREFPPSTAWWKFSTKFNVSAGQFVPAIRLHDQHTEGVMLRWGLIPSWVQGDPAGLTVAGIPAGQIERSKSCGPPWTRGQRCLMPMAGFYVWQLTARLYRQPYFVQLTNRSVFAVAGLWDRWVSDDDDVIESCAIISVPSNELLASIEGPQFGMPAIVRRKDYGVWLQGSPAEAKAALQPYGARGMQAYPVSPRINSATVDDPALIRATSPL
jgi:putative SOS response-associated peptidase YedK